MAIYEVPMPDLMREDLIKRGKNPDDYGCLAIDSSRQEVHIHFQPPVELTRVPMEMGLVKLTTRSGHNA